MPADLQQVNVVSSGTLTLEETYRGDFSAELGTREMPYIIDSPLEWQSIHGSDDALVYYTIAADLNFADLAFAPNSCKNIVINGGGYTLSHLSDSLFNVLDGQVEIHDLKISDSALSSPLIAAKIEENASLHLDHLDVRTTVISSEDDAAALVRDSQGSLELESSLLDLEVISENGTVSPVCFGNTPIIKQSRFCGMLRAASIEQAVRSDFDVEPAFIALNSSLSKEQFKLNDDASISYFGEEHLSKAVVEQFRKNEDGQFVKYDVARTFDSVSKNQAMCLAYKVIDEESIVVLTIYVNDQLTAVIPLY